MALSQQAVQSISPRDYVGHTISSPNRNIHPILSVTGTVFWCYNRVSHPRGVAAMNSVHHKDRLAGRKILVVEDEYMLADDLRQALLAAGAQVLGPVADNQSARDILERETCHCAILDINLNGERSFEVAKTAISKGIPTAFTTGYDRSVLPVGLEGIELFEKPLDMVRLLDFVADAVA